MGRVGGGVVMVVAVRGALCLVQRAIMVGQRMNIVLQRVQPRTLLQQQPGHCQQEHAAPMPNHLFHHRRLL
jgi:hypothetical protein